MSESREQSEQNYQVLQMEKQQPITPVVTQRDIKWADGFRGIAALLVVTSHLTLSFAPFCLAPAPSKDSFPTWYNLPYIRLLVSEGFPWVAVFFLLTGFVNAIGPLKKARAGRLDASLVGLSSSTFRRVGRLVLPCTVATIISWAMCQLGAYELGRISDSDWMRNTSPKMSGNFSKAVKDLFWWIFKTWAHGENTYDKNQWTMTWFLKGSITLFVALLATLRFAPRWRVSVFVWLYIYAVFKKDAMIGMCIYGGALLAEFSLHPTVVAYANNRNMLHRTIPYIFLLVGLFLAGYPNRHAEWTFWSNSLRLLSEKVFFQNPRNFWPTIGVQLVTVSIILSSSLQHALSHPIFTWLGNISFPIYLIHGPLLRSVLNWMLFAFSTPNKIKETNNNGEVTKEYLRLTKPTPWHLAYALPIFFVLLLALAHLWTLKIEPWCAWATKTLEERMVGKPPSTSEDRSTLLPIANGSPTSSSSYSDSHARSIV